MASDDRPPSYLPIGRFSRVTALSVRMLRHYDEHGVLAPAHTDPHTGYRYYSPSQLRDAGRIRVLRDLGFGVAAIARMITSDADTLAHTLAIHRLGLEQEAQLAADRLKTVDRLLVTLKEHPMTLDIVRTTHPAQTAVTLRRVISSYADEGQLWDEMMRLLPPSAYPAIAGPGLAVFHDEDYKEADVDVEIALPVSRPIEVPEPLACVERPAQDVVVATLNGPYDQMADATQAAAAWMETHGLTMAGPMYNRYVVGPAQNPDPQAWVTEVCLAVTDAPAS